MRLVRDGISLLLSYSKKCIYEYLCTEYRILVLYTYSILLRKDFASGTSTMYSPDDKKEKGGGRTCLG